MDNLYNNPELELAIANGKELLQLNKDMKRLEKRVRELERKDNFLGIDIDKLKIGGTD